MLAGKHLKPAVYALLILCLFTFCKTKNVLADATEGALAEEPGVRIKTIVTDYGIIWGMDFLPNGDLLFTEKKGRMYRLGSAGKITEISGVPEVNSKGQGGLMDIKVHPNYASNGWLYCTYSGFDDMKYGILVFARFKIVADKFSNLEILLTTSTPDLWNGHYGSRIAFDKQGMLYVSVGEGGPSSYGGKTSPNMNAQNVKSEWGKIHRMTDDGKVPQDNPILPGNTVATSVYSYGHRNAQGLAFNPLTNELWENEHGPRGGDEANIIVKGKNYGWPLVSFGMNYDGKPVSDNPLMAGIESPAHTWTPSIGACGLAFITTDRFKGWKGNMLTGVLALTHLSRCEIVNGKVVKETKMLSGMGRVRNVIQGRDGNIYVSLEGPGRILQLSPE